MKKILLKIALISFFLLGMILSHSNAAVTTTVPAGSATLSAAVTAASDGDTLEIVGDITETGDISFTKSLTIRAASGLSVKPKVTMKRALISTAGISTFIKGIEFIGASGVAEFLDFGSALTVKNIKVIDCNIHNYTRGFRFGRYLVNVDTFIVDKCIFYEEAYTTVAYPTFGFTSTSNLSIIKSIKITNSTFYNNGCTFIQTPNAAPVGDSTRMVVDHCTFYNVVYKEAATNRYFILSNSSGAVNVRLDFTNNIVSTLADPANALPFSVKNIRATFRNNNFYNFNSTTAANYAFNIAKLYTNTAANITMASNDTITNPQFTNTAGADFTLPGGSGLLIASTTGGPIGDPRWAPNAGPVAPSAPVSSAATNIAQTSFTANWATSSSATKYYLDVATDNGFISFVSGFTNLDVANVTTYSVTGLTANTTYYYRVRAFNTGGTSANSNVIAATTSASVATPDAPVASAPTGVTGTGFNAIWSSSANATGYKLDVATDAGFASILTDYNNLDVPSGLSVAVTGLVANTTYYYRVRAYNGTGTSASSNTISATTAAALQTQTITFTLPTGKVYGDAAFDITGVTSGGSGNPVLFTSSNTAVATVSGNTITILTAGTTTIKANQAGNNSYEASTEVSHDLVVGKATATVIITPGDLAVTYSGTAKTVTATTAPTGKTVDITYDSNAAAPINVGTYAIVATVNDANYTGSATANLVIAKAPLTVTTEPATRMKGLANPAFVLKYTGFVNGETKTALTTEPTATCTADASSAIGNYDVIVSGGTANNYTFTYVKGTLTVTVNTGTTSLSGIAVNAYPNPVVSGKLTVEVPSCDNKSSVSVSSVGGAIVIAKKIDSDITEVNLSAVAPGLYILCIETPAGVIVKRIVKE